MRQKLLTPLEVRRQWRLPMFTPLEKISLTGQETHHGVDKEL